MSTRIATLLERKNDGNQSELARYVGVTPQAVQKWMTGVSEPKGENLRRAAQFLGVTAGYLKFGEDHELNKMLEHIQAENDRQPPPTEEAVLQAMIESASAEIRLITAYRLGNADDRAAIDNAVNSVFERNGILGLLNNYKSRPR